MNGQLKKTKRIELGKWGEGIALDYLLEKGFRLLNKNYRTPDGEIDLVMKKDDELVFVEVKTRKNTEFSLPEESISEEKLDHLEASAGWFLEKYPEYEKNWRLDVITVIGIPNGKNPQVDWFENVTGT